jgi:hypothetical protein
MKMNVFPGLPQMEKRAGRRRPVRRTARTPGSEAGMKRKNCDFYVLSLLP